MGLAAIVVGALLAGLGLSPAVAKPPAAPPTPAALAAGEPGFGWGPFSGNLPNALRDEAVLPYLSLTYQQRARAEGDPTGTYLNTYNPPALQGTRVGHVPTDLALAPTSMNADDGLPLPGNAVFEKFTNLDTLACENCLSNIAEAYHIRTLYTAPNLNAGPNGGEVYLAGTKGSTPDTFQSFVYNVDFERGCAALQCNVEAAQLPEINPAGVGRAQSVTALITGVFDGDQIVVVGTNDGLVMVLDQDMRTLGSFQLPGGDCCQVVVDALALDPAGSGWLAVGAMNNGNIGYLFKLNDNGSFPGQWTTWERQGTDQLSTVPLSVAFGTLDNGSLVAAYGLTGGQLALIDPPTGNQIATYTFADTGPGVSTVNAVPRVDGTTGGSDWAVTLQAPGSFGAAKGALVRFTGTTGAALPLQPAAPSGSPPIDNTLLGTIDEFRDWFPGYKMGTMSLDNQSGEDVTVSLQSRSESQYGCWYAPPSQTAGAEIPQFPGNGISVPAGQQSTLYTIGAYTAGAQGLCGADDVSGDRRAYLVVTPTSHPDDARIVNVLLNDNYTIDVSDQTGGSTTVTAAPGPVDEEGCFEFDGCVLAGPYAYTQFTLTGPGQPTPVTAPTIKSAIQLNNLAVRNRTPVYRVDLGPLSWVVPGATGNRQQAAIPPLQVQASLQAIPNGATWTNVGQFMPINTLNQQGQVVTSGNAATGSGSFFWENPAGAPAYKQLRVVAGSSASAPVVLANLPGPAVPSTPITSIEVSPTKNQSQIATPASNGVDQAQLLVQVNAGVTLPANDPSYASVYYRDDSGDLITNLYQPGASDEFVGVQPTGGAYPNTGSVNATRKSTRRGSVLPAFDYVSAAGSDLRNIYAYVGAGAPSFKSQVKVQGVAFNIAPVANSTAVSGISFATCSDYGNNSNTCQLAPVMPGIRPALYQAGNSTTNPGPLIGVQLQLQAQNALSDLPLQWSASVTQLKLASAPVMITNSTLAQVASKNDFTPTYNVDFLVVSHGQLVQVSTVKVGGN